MTSSALYHGASTGTIIILVPFMFRYFRGEKWGEKRQIARMNIVPLVTVLTVGNWSRSIPYMPTCCSTKSCPIFTLFIIHCLILVHLFLPFPPLIMYHTAWNMDCHTNDLQHSKHESLPLGLTSIYVTSSQHILVFFFGIILPYAFRISQFTAFLRDFPTKLCMHSTTNWRTSSTLAISFIVS